MILRKSGCGLGHFGGLRRFLVDFRRGLLVATCIPVDENHELFIDWVSLGSYNIKLLVMVYFLNLTLWNTFQTMRRLIDVKSPSPISILQSLVQ